MVGALRGASRTPRPEGAWISTAGQFAAEWNARTPEQRAQMFERIREDRELTGSLFERNLAVVTRQQANALPGYELRALGQRLDYTARHRFYDAQQRHEARVRLAAQRRGAK